METYNYDDSGILSGTEKSLSSNDADISRPAEPGFGPAGPEMPSLPDYPYPDEPAAPGPGPIGPVTPALPPLPGNDSSSGCRRCVYPSRPIGNGILWTWAPFPPFFNSYPEISRLRFYNASSIQEPLDFYLNGRAAVTDLDYMNYTRYMHILPGSYRLTVYRRTSPGIPIISTMIRLNRNENYTLSALGTFGTFNVQLMTS